MKFYHTSTDFINVDPLSGKLQFPHHFNHYWIGLHAWQDKNIAEKRLAISDCRTHIYEFELLRVPNCVEDNQVKITDLQQGSDCHKLIGKSAVYVEEDSGPGKGKWHIVVLDYSTIRNFKMIN